jgi:hypothetical protein
LIRRAQSFVVYDFPGEKLFAAKRNLKQSKWQVLHYLPL